MADNGRIEGEHVFCYECDNEWPRNQGGLQCPRCHSEFVEIVSALEVSVATTNTLESSLPRLRPSRHLRHSEVHHRLLAMTTCIHYVVTIPGKMKISRTLRKLTSTPSVSTPGQATVQYHSPQEHMSPMAEVHLADVPMIQLLMKLETTSRRC